MDLDITFDGVTMQTPVYIKLDAPEQLLLSGVCRQLKILTYHPDVARWVNRRDECGDSEVRESAARTTLEQGRTGDGRTEKKNELSKQSTTTRQFEGVSEDVPKEENKKDNLGQ